MATPHKISPLYANVIDYLQVYGVNVYKHHKTDNIIHFWIRPERFYYEMPADIKTAVYEYFKSLVNFFLTGNVAIQMLENNNMKVSVRVPKTHIDKLFIQPTGVDTDKEEITNLVKSISVNRFSDVEFKVNGSNRHIRVYSIPTEHIADYVKEVFEAFSSKGWTAYRINDFTADPGLKNIHFFYKKVD